MRNVAGSLSTDANAVPMSWCIRFLWSEDLLEDHAIIQCNWGHTER